MKFLLDTNVCIEAMRGNLRVHAHFRKHRPQDCAVSTVTVYELISGVHKCRAPDAERAKVELFLAPLHVVPFDHEAALQAAVVRARLERSGEKIGPYDVQLAGHALALRLTLVTHNLGEFGRVEDLVHLDWQR